MNTGCPCPFCRALVADDRPPVHYPTEQQASAEWPTARELADARAQHRRPGQRRRLNPLVP